MEPKCFKHPNKFGKYYCSKYNRYLCQDCMSCQDPKGYCKFRQMCIIWEFSHHGTPDMQDRMHDREKKPKDGLKPKPIEITFIPTNKTIDVEPGITLIEAARKWDTYINAARCGGNGLCSSRIISFVGSLFCWCY